MLVYYRLFRWPTYVSALRCVLNLILSWVSPIRGRFDRARYRWRHPTIVMAWISNFLVFAIASAKSFATGKSAPAAVDAGFEQAFPDD